MLTQPQRALFAELKESIDWTAADMVNRLMQPPAVGAPLPIEMTDQWQLLCSSLRSDPTIKQPLQQAFQEALLTQAHTFLVMLDGGTQLVESGRLMLCDAKLNHLGEGLHELFFDYLDETNNAAPSTL